MLQTIPICCFFMETPSTSPEMTQLAPHGYVVQRKRGNVFFHRAGESLRLVGTSEHYPGQPVLKAESVRAVAQV